MFEAYSEQNPARQEWTRTMASFVSLLVVASNNKEEENGNDFCFVLIASRWLY